MGNYNTYKLLAQDDSFKRDNLALPALIGLCSGTENSSDRLKLLQEIFHGPGSDQLLKGIKPDRSTIVQQASISMNSNLMQSIVDCLSVFPADLAVCKAGWYTSLLK